jgi:hypothetical protein
MTDRRNCLTHPIQAWRAFTAAVTDRADADARAAGLVLFDPLPNGVHRCRDRAWTRTDWAPSRAGSCRW